MTLPDLGGLPSIATQRGGDPTLLHAELLHHLDRAIATQPRSLQARVGPSELGGCLRCLGHRLAGITPRRDPAWLPWIGTAIHAQLADVFTQANAGLDAARWLVEMRVDVGEVDGAPVVGTADLYDRVTATVVDWKTVGAATLKRAKGGPSATYRVQAHLYGRGFVRRGLPVDTVAVAYLPRNAVSARQGLFWHEPYDEQIAVDALARADALATALRLAGPDKVLPSLPGDDGCYSCPSWPLPDGTYPATPGHTPDLMSDLLAS